MKRYLRSTYMLATIAALAAPVAAQEMMADEGQLDSLFPAGTPYSPYADRSFPERPLWGD